MTKGRRKKAGVEIARYQDYAALMREHRTQGTIRQIGKVRKRREQSDEERRFSNRLQFGRSSFWKSEPEERSLIPSTLNF
jgi:hypothetical protein